MKQKRSHTLPVLWALRLLVNAGCYAGLRRHRDWPDTSICELLDLPFAEANRDHQARVLGRLKAMLAELEQSPPAADKDTVAHNVALLGERIGLSRNAQTLLTFVLELEVNDALSTCLKAMRANKTELLRGIGHALRLDPREVRAELRSDAPLMSLGFVRFGRGDFIASGPSIEPNTAFEGVMQLEYADADALMERFYAPLRPATLTLKDFEHLAEDVALIRTLLGAGIGQRERGVNMLLYGAAGNGKTELARALAESLGARLYEVRAADEDGDVCKPEARRANYALSQRFLKQSENALVLFDEVEDILPRNWTAFWGLENRSTSFKGWMNRTLEDNPVPAIWIGNTVDQLDPAFLRRFSYVVELKTPPAKVRRRIFEGHAEGLPISSEWLHRVSHDDRVRPGHIENAARVARLLQPGTEQECEATLSRVIDGALVAEGQLKVSKTATCDACAYDPSLVNADQDLESIVSGFDRCRVGTLCLYGPPGTGKSAYVAYLAERLGVPLLIRRASDIMSHFWGGTEKNIAAMFRKAEAEQALLFVDEADSFFKDREQVTYSWERSEVNELLTHMETFEGMFVCATNLMEGMDPAVFRRFSLKVRLDPLRPDQRWKMLAATLRGLGVTVPRGAPAKAARSRLERLDQLTPGDFAAVARRIRLTQPKLSAQVVVEALADECQYKPGADVRSIGFAR